jgi:hypothetical protein
MACLEEYPIIETAIKYGVSAWGKEDIMAIQIAGFWIDGWLTANAGKITPEDAMIIKMGVQNYYFV